MKKKKKNKKKQKIRFCYNDFLKFVKFKVKEDKSDFGKKFDGRKFIGTKFSTIIQVI